MDNKYGEQSDPQTLEALLNLDVVSSPDVDDDTPVVDDDEPVVDDDTPVVDDDAPVVVDDGLVSSGSNDSTFDAQSDASFMVMLSGFLGMGGFVAQRKLDKTGE